MKIIIPLILLAFLASCGPSKYSQYECPKYVGICIDTIPVHLIDTSYSRLLPLTIGSVAYRQIGHSDSFRVIKPSVNKTDTIPEWMHVSMRPKGFVIAQMALAVRVDDICVGHLDCAGKPFPEHYRVGWCQGKEELLNRLVKGRAGR